jgi:IS1 family transposase
LVNFGDEDIGAL